MKCIGVLWNSMNDFVDMAIDDLSKKATIEDIIEIDLGEHLSSFIRDVYGYNTPETQWKIDYKLDHIVGSYSSRVVHILFLEIEAEEMEYVERKKEYVPSNINALKKSIRAKYSEIVDHYAFDNIFHMTESEEEYARTLMLLQEYIEALSKPSVSKVKKFSLRGKNEKQC